MALFRRSLSYGSTDDKYEERNKRKHSRSNSIFASAWSLLVGTDDDKTEQPAVGTPELHQEVHLTKEDAWLQACYTAMALVFVFISGCIFIAVFYILEPFLHPLLWAVLVGMVLHPFKYASTSEIHDWLGYLDSSGIPLSVGVVLSPFFVFNWLSQCFENVFLSNWKTIVGLVVCSATMVVCYVFSLPVYVYTAIQMATRLADYVNAFMGHTGLLQMCSLVLGFLLLLILTSQYSGYRTALKSLSVCLWFLALLNVGVYLCGAIAVPVVVILFAGSIVTSLVWTAKEDIAKRRKKRMTIVQRTDSEIVAEEGLLEKGLSLDNLKRMQSEETSSELEFDDMQMQTKMKERPNDKVEPCEKKASTPDTSGQGVSSGLGMTEDEATFDLTRDDGDDTAHDVEHRKVSFGPGTVVEQYSPGTVDEQYDDQEKPPPLDISDLGPLVKKAPLNSKGRSKPSSRQMGQRKEGSPIPSRGVEEVDGGRFRRLASPRKDSVRARAQSNQVFLILFIASLMVTLWKYPILLLFPTPAVVWSFIKYIISLAIIQNSVLTQISSSWTTLKTRLTSQRKILFPWPMPTMFAVYLIIDSKVLNSTKKTMGSLMSAFIILVLLVSALAVTVVVVFQIQVEVMHYLSSAVMVWNRTVATNPQIKEWMGIADENETLQDTLETFASQNYVYAREWLADRIHSLVSDSKVNTTQVEQRVLEMVDRLYNIYVVQNSSSPISNTCTKAGINNSMLEDSTSDGSEQHYHLLGTVSELLPLINWETSVTVLKSLWSILSDNLPVAFSFLYAILELLFSGGTALLNAIVFLTALFYLLSYSEEDYLPVKWIMDFLPHLNSPTSGNEGEIAGGNGGNGGVSKETGPQGGGGKDYGKVFSRAIRSVFHATFRRAFFYGLYTWLTHTLFGLPVSILPAVLAGVAGAIPFIGSYWVAVPAVLELWLLEGNLLAALGLLSLSLLPVFFVDTLINREIEGGHPYLTGLAIAGGIYFAGLEGALIGPILLSCLLFVVDFYDDSFF